MQLGVRQRCAEPERLCYIILYHIILLYYSVVAGRGVAKVKLRGGAESPCERETKSKTPTETRTDRDTDTDRDMDRDADTDRRPARARSGAAERGALSAARRGTMVEVPSPMTRTRLGAGRAVHLTSLLAV